MSEGGNARAASFLQTTQSVLESYGWFIVLGCLVLYFAYQQLIKCQRHKTSKIDPVRQAQLDAEMRRQRELQQERWLEQSRVLYKQEQQQKHEREGALKHFSGEPVDKKNYTDTTTATTSTTESKTNKPKKFKKPGETKITGNNPWFGSSNDSALSSYRPDVAGRYRGRRGGG